MGDPKRRRDWPLGTRSPFEVAVTCFPRPERYQSRDEWVSLWWSTQSPMSEMIQPRSRYVRNAVRTVVTSDAPPFAGIVVEVWPSVWHMTNPFLFFHARGPWELFVHICVMLRSVLNIMDFSHIQQATMSEYIIK